MPIPSTLTSVLAIATCSLAAWGGHPGQDASTGMDPDAQKLLERMGKFYDSLDAATFKATMEMSDSRLPSPISITTSSAIGPGRSTWSGTWRSSSARAVGPMTPRS